MTEFKVTEFTKDGHLGVVRIKKQEIKGLPPTSSQVILMDRNEINDLIKVLQDYANKG